MKERYGKAMDGTEVGRQWMEEGGESSGWKRDGKAVTRRGIYIKAVDRRGIGWQ